MEQALGVTKDALPIASSIARAGFNIVRVPLLSMFSSSLSRLRLSSANHSAPRHMTPPRSSCNRRKALRRLDSELENKQGVDWEYEVEKAPAYPAAGNCQGTYVHLPPRAHLYQPTAVESASPPFQLVGGKAEGSVSAKQFLGRTSTLLWKTGTGSIDSESGTIALRFSNSTAATSSPPTPPHRHVLGGLRADCMGGRRRILGAGTKSRTV